MCFVQGERAVNDIRMFATVPNSKYLRVTLQRYVKLNYGGVLFKALYLTPHKHLATSVCTVIYFLSVCSFICGYSNLLLCYLGDGD